MADRSRGLARNNNNVGQEDDADDWIDNDHKMMLIIMTRALSLYAKAILTKKAFETQATRKQTRTKMQLDLTASNKTI